MKISKNKYSITDEASAIDIDAVQKLLSTSYWASNRCIETINKSIEHSVCFSLFYESEQIGFARIVTDFATTGYLADVIIDNKYRGDGLGKWFVKTIIEDKRWDDMLLLLVTGDAHKLYEKYGFKNSERVMIKGKIE